MGRGCCIASHVCLDNSVSETVGDNHCSVHVRSLDSVSPIVSKSIERRFMIAPVEKMALFIDGANLYATTKKLGIEIDYKKLLQEFRSAVI